MGEFRMPSLGDAVKRGDIVAIVGTDKADIEVEVYETGTVRTLIAQPGEKLPVGAPLALLEVPGEAAPSAGVPPPRPTPTPQPAGRIHASPLARKLADELGVDLANVQGTGPHGIIESHDVERAAAKPAARAAPAVQPAASAAAEPPSGMRRAIAAAMARSNREIPHYYLSTQIDMSTTIGWLEQTNRQRSIEKRLLPAALLLKGVARALVEVPELNGYWVEDQLKPSAEIHLGVAVSLRTGGLMVPTIHSANQRSLDELMTDLRDIITRTRAGRLRSSDITDSTITITNLGDLGVETVYGVIYPPQVALVGFGKIVERPWTAHGMLGVRPVLTATLAADHRATDGRRGAQFLDILSSALQKPQTL